ncbi:DUF3221 domain-containing protein [Paenibacillus koleovorans]|uniref:DUF3221 domain-containing protein n=1 Tax=Paenibacillus koleovorans TaxID=121608 RepID=UPI000FD8A162|nr:DUF3221 domain-containing protein [Paenibacillus koleovorans]
MVGGYVRQVGLVLLCGALLLLIACSDQTSSNAFTGYVTKIEGHRALVINPGSRSINPSNPEYYEAVWVSSVPSKIKVGQQVQVWFAGNEIATSYPGQGKAAKVTVIQTSKPDKADLAQDEVIRKALLNEGIASLQYLVIKDVSYDEITDSWTIRYRGAMDASSEVRDFQVPDQ